MVKNPLAKIRVKVFLFLLSTIASASADSRPRTFCNPMDLDYRFQSPEANYRSAADPVIVRFRDVYWLFASKSGGYWRSTNLLDWTFVAASGYPTEIWAPTAAVINGRLYVTIGHSDGTFATDDPASGKWTNVTTYPRALADPDTMQADDGRVYLYDGCSPTQPLRVVELDPRTLQFASATVEIARADPAHRGWEVCGDANLLGDKRPWIEGSWVNQFNGRYYLQYAAPGAGYKTYADGVLVSDKPTGPFVYQPYSPFSFKPTGFIAGAGHSCTFADAHGQYWHVTTMTISQRNGLERRLGLFPAGVLPGGQLATSTYLGDYPQFAPGIAQDPLTDNSPHWMLLSYVKPVTASSTLAAKGTRSFGATNAVDEDIRTWWSAATGKSGEWLKVDLTKNCRIDALQINFADQAARTTNYLAAQKYFYFVEASRDGINWKTIIDRRETGRDAPHDYVQLASPVEARYVRITNVQSPSRGLFSLYDFRIFGSGLGSPPPEIRTFTVDRNPADPRKARVSWSPVTNTDFYIVRYGIAPDRLFNSYQVYRAADVTINSLNTGVQLLLHRRFRERHRRDQRHPNAQAVNQRPLPGLGLSRSRLLKIF